METRDLTLISDYLAGELTEQDRQEVAQRLQADAAFAAMLQEQGAHVTVLHATARAEAKADLRNQYQAVKKKQALTRRLWIYSAVASVAATVLLLLWALPRQAAPSPEQMALAYLEPFPVDNIRGETPSEQSLLDSAFAYYRQDEFSKALSILNGLHTSDPGNPQVAMYLGECLSQRGEYAEAARVFAPLAESSPFQDAAQWRLALSLLLAGKDSLAYERLQEIRQSDRHYRQMEADRLLKAMAQE